METVFSSPNPILFGCGSSDKTGEKLRLFGCTKVMLVYDRGIKNAGIADRIISSVRSAGLEAVCFEDVHADPPDWSVEQAAALAVREGILIVFFDYIC